MDERVVKNLIIGFGKAGKTLDADMAGHGETVMLVEESNMMYGGTCINVGCIPSKKLIVEGEKGQLTADKKEVFARAMALKEALIGKLRDVNYHKVADLEGVEVVDATASFVDSHRVRLIGKDGETLVKADRIFINTGSSPNQLKIAGADSKRVYDSTGLLSLEERPDRLVIIGGGYISLEFAFMRSEEHTSELQSRQYLVCRLLLEKKKYTLFSFSFHSFLLPPGASSEPQLF